MAIDLSVVRRIAALAQLDLDDAGARELCGQLQAILDHVAVLERLDTNGVPPTAFGAGREDGLREDVVAPGLTRDEALSNAPDAVLGHFRVPRVIEG